MPEFNALPNNKAELLERIHQARSELEKLLEGLSEAQLTKPGPDGGWSIKDHQAHIATWEKYLVALLNGRPSHEGFGLDKASYDAAQNTDELNALLDQRNKKLGLSEVQTLFKQAHAEVVLAISKLSDEELFKTITYFQPDDPDERQILPKIVGDTYGHYLEHFEWIEPLIR